MQVVSAKLFGISTRLMMDLDPAQSAAPILLIWVAQDGIQARYRFGVTFEVLGAEARIALQRLFQKRAR